MESKVLKIISLHLNIEVPLGLNDNLFTDHNADSLDIVEIWMALEDEFNMEIPENKVENAETPADWIKACQK